MTAVLTVDVRNLLNRDDGDTSTQGLFVTATPVWGPDPARIGQGELVGSETWVPSQVRERTDENGQARLSLRASADIGNALYVVSIPMYGLSWTGVEMPDMDIDFSAELVGRTYPDVAGGLTPSDVLDLLDAQWAGPQSGPIRIASSDGVATVAPAVPDWRIYATTKQQLPFVEADFTGANANGFDATAGGTEVFPVLWAGSNRHVAFWVPARSPAITAINIASSGSNSIGAFTEVTEHVNVGGVPGRVLYSTLLFPPFNPVVRYTLHQPFGGEVVDTTARLSSAEAQATADTAETTAQAAATAASVTIAFSTFLDDYTFTANNQWTEYLRFADGDVLANVGGLVITGNAGANRRIVVPKDGTYRVHAQVFYNTGGGGRHEPAVRVSRGRDVGMAGETNMVISGVGIGYDRGGTDGCNEAAPAVTTLAALEAGDEVYIELALLSTANAGGTIDGSQSQFNLEYAGGS